MIDLSDGSHGRSSNFILIGVKGSRVGCEIGCGVGTVEGYRKFWEHVSSRNRGGDPIPQPTLQPISQHTLGPFTPINIKLDDFSWDPSDRPIMYSYDPNMVEKIRRMYLDRGPCRLKGHKFPTKMVGSKKRSFVVTCEARLKELVSPNILVKVTKFTSPSIQYNRRENTTFAILLFRHCKYYVTIIAFIFYAMRKSVSIINYHGEKHMSIISKAFEFATLSVFAVVLLLSLISIVFIFYLRLKSRSSPQLRKFNKQWTVRLLLVVFVSSWAVNELLLRVPFLQETLTLSKKFQLCKFHVVLSLGFLEPGFLVTLLYLINVSIKQRSHKEKWSVLFVIVMSLPTLFLQAVFFFLTPLKEKIPSVMTRTSLFSVDSLGDNKMICTYPLVSSIIFCGFAIVYSMGLLLACWRVGSLVINKTIRVRINMLGMTVMLALLVQALFLGAESLWMPEEMGVGAVSLGIIVSVAVCSVVGEIVLVIKPVMEALETDGECTGDLNDAM
nr:trichohyalin like [Tanacetum cinerariifolium]